MKSAIITGVNGLLGESLATFLIKKNIQVIGISRKRKNLIKEIDKSLNFNFVELDLSQIEKLPELIESKGIKIKTQCTFYHFGWGGQDKLTDGKFEDQFKNVSYSAKAVQVASKCACHKFVNVGTIEESYLENVLNKNRQPEELKQLNYAISKTASRDMSQLVAYLEKIDYIHTRISVPIDETLSRGGYIPQTMRQIVNGIDFSEPKNSQYFDFIFLQDLCEAYYRIGCQGRNKANYYIGPGKPKTLMEYFSELKLYLEGKSISDLKNSIYKDNDIFNTDSIKTDLNFTCEFKMEELLQKRKK